MGRAKRHVVGIHRRGRDDGGKGVHGSQKGATMSTQRRPFADNRFLQIVAGCYIVLWIALAIRPLDRSDWLLENLLVFATAIVLGLTYHRFQFSNLSYALLALFLALHTVGAHYTYAKVPVGFWLQHFYHLNRNHYDRVIHFSFGLLIVYPVRELLARSAGAREAWAMWLALGGTIALSSFFEIIEAVVAQVVRPDLGAAYLGTQGDIWDAQKDMTAAVLGAALTMILLLSSGRHRRARDPIRTA